MYVFQIRVGVNSGTANKRVEFAPYVNGSRLASHCATYSTPGNIYRVFMTTLILELSEGNTVDFRIAPVESMAVNVQIYDISVFALDWDGKVNVS